MSDLYLFRIDTVDGDTHHYVAPSALAAILLYTDDADDDEVDLDDLSRRTADVLRVERMALVDGIYPDDEGEEDEEEEEPEPLTSDVAIKGLPPDLEKVLSEHRSLADCPKRQPRKPKD